MSYVNLSQMYNPFFFRDMSDNVSESLNLNGTVYADFSPIKNLTYTSKLGYNITASYQNRYNYPYYYNPLRSEDRARLSTSISQGIYYQWDNYVNYLFGIGKNSFTTMLGMAYQTSDTKSVSGSTDELTNTLPNYRYLAYSTPGAIDDVGGTSTESANISYFGRLGWDYESKYNIQATFRADAFDTSKLDKQSRWGYFPSISAGWTISNERFFKEVINPSIISLMKIRSSWGINGNVNVLNNYQYANTLASGYFHMDGTGGITYGTYPQTRLQNPNLRWEESRQIDIGLDSRFFKDRLSLTIDFYSKNTDGLLINITPALSSGASSQFVNAGIIHNRGFEFESTWKDNINAFSYSVSTNFATLYNIVKEAPSKLTGTGTHAGTTVTYFEEGFPVWYIKTYKIDHIDENGYAVYKDFDGIEGITDADREYAGSAILTLLMVLL
jgi:outer membrane receptor protein involved in Fe transport